LAKDEIETFDAGIGLPEMNLSEGLDDRALDSVKKMTYSSFEQKSEKKKRNTKFIY